jgi:hypothetical protein
MDETLFKKHVRILSVRAEFQEALRCHPNAGEFHQRLVKETERTLQHSISLDNGRVRMNYPNPENSLGMYPDFVLYTAVCMWHGEEHVDQVLELQQQVESQKKEIENLKQALAWKEREPLI